MNAEHTQKNIKTAVVLSLNLACASCTSSNHNANKFQKKKNGTIELVHIYKCLCELTDLFQFSVEVCNLNQLEFNNEMGILVCIIYSISFSRMIFGALFSAAAINLSMPVSLALTMAVQAGAVLPLSVCVCMSASVCRCFVSCLSLMWSHSK